MLSLYVCVQFVCLHMYACTSEEMHKRKIALWLLSESHVPRDDEFCMGLVSSVYSACLLRAILYIYTLLYLQADT